MKLFCLCHTDHTGCAVSVCDQTPVFKIHTTDHVYRICATCWDRLARIGALNEETGRYLRPSVRNAA